MIRYVSDAPNAPKASGPYSQATVLGNLALISGQLPIDPALGTIVESGIDAQTEQVMKNLAAVLRHLGLDFSGLARTTIYLTDLRNFAAVNKIYERFLGSKKPARSTIQVAALPLGALIEIDGIAAFEGRPAQEKGGVFY